MIDEILAYLTALLSGLAIVLGGIVEGYGYGLSLGTNWPYTNNILQLAVKGDPEAIHRIVATLLGVLALILLIIDFNTITLVGFIAIVFTALLGMATLYVLVGKLPSIFQGFHDIAAYTTFVSYLILATNYVSPNKYLGFLINAITPPHILYLVIFMGGVVTGTRRMKLTIGTINDVIKPKNGLQWAWVIHGILSAIFFIELIIFKYWIPLIFSIIEIAVGLSVYYKINKNPTKPGIFVGLHQLFSLAVVVSLLFFS